MKPSARDRTIPMPGVDAREQRNRAEPIVDGPRVKVYRVFMTAERPRVVLLTEKRKPVVCITLCAVSGAVERHQDAVRDGLQRQRICQACRARASQLRAEVSRGAR